MSDRRVIYIEEDPYVGESLERSFFDYGIECRSCKTIEDAKKLIAKEAPEAILLGICLSQQNGFEALSSLKADPETKHLPVMMLSVLSGREDIERCFSMGCCEYFILSQHTPKEIVVCMDRLRGSDR